MRSLALGKATDSRIGFEQRLPVYFILLVVACIALTGCRSGQVNEVVHWGPIPNAKKMVKLKQDGVKTIVNCRLNRLPKLERKANEIGLNWVHIPTGLFLPPGDEEITAFLNVINDKTMTPIYICDQVARDRTQFYAAVGGMATEKWPAEKASKAMYLNHDWKGSGEIPTLSSPLEHSFSCMLEGFAITFLFYDSNFYRNVQNGCYRCENGR
jgi:protein tyrosine phosphatase (PTP) superfamily phosphohydrolase (DUF442 family)